MTKNIAIHMKALDRSFWSNGMIQHAFFQAKLFHNLGYKVYMISSKLDKTKSFDFVEQVQEGWFYRNLYWIESKQDKWIELDFDLFILWETNFSENIMNDIKTRFECPIIAMQCGNEGFKIWNEFYQDKNTTIPLSLDHTGKLRYDQLWTIPHHAKFKSLYDSIYQTNTQIVPYLWEPFINQPHMELYTLQNIYDKLNIDKPIISICEPDRDIVKMSLYPILGASKIKNAVINVYGKKLQTSIKHLSIKQLNYMPRTAIYDILKNTTIIISHQIMNELNYLHLEAAWFGIPIIHNSPMLKEIGWYYHENDIDSIPKIWATIQKLSYIDYLKKVQHDREFIKQNYFTNVPKNLAYFKNAVIQLLNV